MKDRFVGRLKSGQLISPDSGILIALSGGVDSVVLLDLLLDQKESMNLRLGVAHFNHKIRGRQADEDESFVRELVAGKGLMFFSGALVPRPPESKDSWEAYARRCRYEFLEKTRNKGKFDWIATAHHADDQAETILMRMIEGSGIQGLLGIRERHGHIIRPLLSFTKNETLEYARENKLEYREDMTNKDVTIPRNYVRHELIPRIRELNPGFASGMSRLADNMGEAEFLIRTLVKKSADRITSDVKEGHTVLDADLLSKEPMLIQKRLVHELASSDTPRPRWRQHVWKNLGGFLNQSTTGEVLSLPGGWTLLRNRGEFLLSRKTVHDIKVNNWKIEFQPDTNVSVSTGEFSFQMDVFSQNMEFSDDPTVEFVDYGRLWGQTMAVRVWRSGDRMKPLGLSGFKKVSDILVDGKVDRFQKESQCVLTSNDEIVWLCGLCLDDRYKVTDETIQFARLRWNRIDE